MIDRAPVGLSRTKILDLIGTLSPDRTAFYTRLVRALVLDRQALMQALDRDSGLIERLMLARDIRGLDRWLRRQIIRGNTSRQSSSN